MRTTVLATWMLAALVACGRNDPKPAPAGGKAEGAEPLPAEGAEPSPEDPEQVVMGLVTREHTIMLELEHAEGERRARLETELEGVQRSLAPRLAAQPDALASVIRNVEEDIERASPEVRDDLKALADDLRRQQTQPRLDPDAVRALLERREQLHRQALAKEPAPSVQTRERADGDRVVGDSRTRATVEPTVEPTMEARVGDQPRLPTADSTVEARVDTQPREAVESSPRTRETTSVSPREVTRVP